MNNWYKIGMPVLVVILLIVCAVTITLLATRYGQDRTVLSTSSVPLRASTQYAESALYPNCPGYTQSTASAGEGGTLVPGNSNTGLPPCCVSGTQGNNTSGGYGRGGCCGGYQD